MLIIQLGLAAKFVKILLRGPHIVKRGMLLYEEISYYGISNGIVALAGYDTIKHHL